MNHYNDGITNTSVSSSWNLQPPPQNNGWNNNGSNSNNVASPPGFSQFGGFGNGNIGFGGYSSNLVTGSSLDINNDNNLLSDDIMSSLDNLLSDPAMNDPQNSAVSNNVVQNDPARNSGSWE